MPRSLPGIINQLKKTYRMTGGSEPEWILGINFKVDSDTGAIELGQGDYVDQMLLKFGLAESKSQPTPATMERLRPTPQDVRPMTKAEFPYREAVGSILYLVRVTRPDASFAAGQVAKFANSPSRPLRLSKEFYGTSRAHCSSS